MRYVLTIQEDWGYIKDVIRMRDVSPSPAGLLIHPTLTVKCIYVPLVMSAAKAADELSIASAIRGIKNPVQLTCMVRIRRGPSDQVVMALAVGYLVIGLWMRAGGVL